MSKVKLEIVNGKTEDEGEVIRLSLEFSQSDHSCVKLRARRTFDGKVCTFMNIWADKKFQVFPGLAEDLGFRFVK